ncbi:histidine phosphatase family protein [Archangium primigenium]|uniref:histidine phosphatase family protein n=1 Tax=[Archangium] primigenium TaxID=2792470 RepID=UPI00195AAE43|nr:histidine phosphatase family protein [Archangium primigenium]MBM7116817.1 histidine phosphatase family protein [Archangium primigenium]
MGAVYFVRHGQASFGRKDYDQLSETGFEQARVLGESLRARLPGVDAVFMGRMARHRQTAETCLGVLGVSAEPRILAGLDEFDHEELIRRHTPRYADPVVLQEEMMREADPRRAFQALFAQAVERWVLDTTGGYTESWSAFRQRCLDALETILQTPSGTVLVFTSAGPISAVCQELLHIPDAHAFQLNWTMANAAVTKVIHSARGRYLSTLNEHAHFEGARRALLTYR